MFSDIWILWWVVDFDSSSQKQLLLLPPHEQRITAIYYLRGSYSSAICVYGVHHKTEYDVNARCAYQHINIAISAWVKSVVFLRSPEFIATAVQHKLSVWGWVRNKGKESVVRVFWRCQFFFKYSSPTSAVVNVYYYMVSNTHRISRSVLTVDCKYGVCTQYIWVIGWRWTLCLWLIYEKQSNLQQFKQRFDLLLLILI